MQFNELSSYGHSESTSYSKIVVINNMDQTTRKNWFHQLGEKEYGMFLLPSTIAFTIGPLTLLLLNKHKSYLKGVTKHSTFARHFLCSIMITSTMGALCMYTLSGHRWFTVSQKLLFLTNTSILTSFRRML